MPTCSRFSRALLEDTERLRFRCELGPMKGYPGEHAHPEHRHRLFGGPRWPIGVPSPFETDPAVMISWLHDGGANWSRPVARSFGQIGSATAPGHGQMAWAGAPIMDAAFGRRLLIRCR